MELFINLIHFISKTIGRLSSVIFVCLFNLINDSLNLKKITNHCVKVFRLLNICSVIQRKLMKHR